MENQRAIGRKTRMILLAVQHLLAATVAVCLMILLMNTYITVDGTNYYSVDLFGEEKNFADTDAFTYILRDSVRDIARMNVICSQMETNGEFDGSRHVDVREYSKRKEEGAEVDGQIVAYTLEDLLKWDMYGMEYKEATFPTREEAINFFSPGLLEKYISLFLSGELSNGMTLAEQTELIEMELIGIQRELSYTNLKIDDSYEDIWENCITKVYEEVLQQLRNYGVAYTDVPAAGGETGDAGTGERTLTVRMLDERYKTVANGTLVSNSISWKGYLELQKNLTDTITSLGYNYKEYKQYKDSYSANRTNIRYCIKMVVDGKDVYFTNLDEFINPLGMDDYIKQFGKYIVYYPATMLYDTNTTMETQELLDIFNEYKYAYSEMTRIWIGVDTSYPVQGDYFSQGSRVYGNLQNVWMFVGLIAGALLAWMTILIFLSVMAGRNKEKDGTCSKQQNWFDRISTEIVLLFAGIIILGGVVVLYAMGSVSSLRNWYIVQEQSRVCVTAALGAALISGLVTLFWYSLMRRIKDHSLWKNSLLRRLCMQIGRTGRSFLVNKTITVRVVLPFILFLVADGILCALMAVMFLEYRGWRLAAAIAAALAFNVFIGRILFKNAVIRQRIIEGINRIREGETNYQIDMEDMWGENKILAEAVNNIGEGIRKAVETSMKDERMKTDLITNVSHDIKTPLTSIINYVDLLKREHIGTEPVKGYIEVLDAKSQRLKQLTDDLVEASKISSGNITLVMEKINLVELLNQSVGEFCEKFAEKGLVVVTDYGIGPAVIEADSRRIWRVIENLFNNIYKYAMEGTRIYIDVVKETDAEGKGHVSLAIKNISSQPLNIRAEELTERFIRGDISRSTEGSGLGLSIAKSLTEVQNGSFQIYLDGDLFKSVMTFPLEEAEPAAPATDASIENPAEK